MKDIFFSTDKLDFQTSHYVTKLCSYTHFEIQIQRLVSNSAHASFCTLKLKHRDEVTVCKGFYSLHRVSKQKQECVSDSCKWHMLSLSAKGGEHLLQAETFKGEMNCECTKLSYGSRLMNREMTAHNWPYIYGYFHKLFYYLSSTDSSGYNDLKISLCENKWPLYPDFYFLERHLTTHILF